MKKKLILLLTTVILIGALAVGTTYAFLTDKEAAKNTFTIGNVAIRLDEAPVVMDEEGNYIADPDKTKETDRVKTNSYTFFPGQTLFKDPRVTVENGSEKCWVFIKVEGTEGIREYLTFDIKKDTWQELKDKDGKTVPGVYYQVVAKNEEENTYLGILDGDEVSVSEEVTKGKMKALANNLGLKFSAYACQLNGFYDATKSAEENAFAAWEEVTTPKEA